MLRKEKRKTYNFYVLRFEIIGLKEGKKLGTRREHNVVNLLFIFFLD